MAYLQEHGARFAVASDCRPVQGGAPFFIRKKVACVHHQQQPDGVGKALVRRPVQGGSAVVVGHVHVGAPLHGDVVEQAGLAVLRRNMAHRVAPARCACARTTCTRQMQQDIRTKGRPNKSETPCNHLQSLALRSAPARSSVSAALREPRTAAQCRAVWPVESAPFTLQPCSVR